MLSRETFHVFPSYWKTVLLSKYRVRHGKLFLLTWVWQIEILKLDCFQRWIWNPEIWENLLVQPFFMKFIMYAIYSPIWKHAKKNYGKKILNASIVKTFPKLKFNVFCGFLMPFCFNLWLKVIVYLIHGLLLVIAWKWPLKLVKIQNSLRTKRYLQIGL